MAYVRTVKTASGATAVQIVHGTRRGARRMEHVGSAHDEHELAALQAAAAQRLALLYPQLELDLNGADGGDDGGGVGDAATVTVPGPLPIVSSRAGPLWDGLAAAYDVLGFEAASGGDEVFRQLVLARIIEPTSKQDSLRVLGEVGVDPVPSYATLKRRLPVWATSEFGRKLAAACAAHAALGPASLVLYDVSTLYFETDTGDGFREPGFSKERRLEPQITIGLLTDAAGFPLMVEAFEGNAAETTTMLPTITAFMAAHELGEVTIVADAGMISSSNKQAIEAAGLSFILGTKIPDLPYVVTEWRRQHPGDQPPDGLILTQPWPAGPRDKRRDQVIYYQYRADRARRTLHGIDEQIGKAEKAVAGKVPVKRNRFIRLVGADKSVNRTLEAKARALAGWKGYTTNLTTCPDNTPVTAEFVISAYHRLFQIEASFRMSKHDLAARPIYHRKRESIEAHLAVVFAALAVGRLVEERTGWSIRRFVRTARRYRTVQIRAGQQLITAADPIPTDLGEALAEINRGGGAH
jgi:Transposase DDE domain